MFKALARRLTKRRRAAASGIQVRVSASEMPLTQGSFEITFIQEPTFRIFGLSRIYRQPPPQRPELGKLSQMPSPLLSYQAPW
jgi:hypothetical protein